jgi:hypothetical protein
MSGSIKRIRNFSILSLIILFTLAPLLQIQAFTIPQRAGRSNIADVVAAQIPVGGYSLHIKTFASTDYGYINKNIAEISTVEGKTYVFQVFVNIIDFSRYPAGTVLKVNVIDSEERLRYAFALTTDNSVIFHYPCNLTGGSAVYTQANGWTAGRWHNLTTIVSGPHAYFYINGTLVGGNDEAFPAKVGGYTLKQIKLGETDEKYVSADLLVDAILFAQDNVIKFSEGFEEGLSSYLISKSTNAIVETINPSAYTTLTLTAEPISATAGDKIIVSGYLRDSYNSGLEGKQIILQYQASGESWTVIATLKTVSKGFYNFSWETPRSIAGAFFVKAHFLGDEKYSPSTSNTVMVVVKAPPARVLDAWLLFILAVILISSTIVVRRKTLASFISGRKEHVQKILACALLAAGAINVFFGSVMIVNWLRIEYYLAYSPLTLKLTIFSMSMDSQIWFGSLILLLAMLYAIKFLTRLRIPASVLLTQLAFPISLIYFFNSLLESGMTLLLFGSFSTLCMITVYSKEILSLTRARAVALFSIFLLSILFPIEFGSALAWIYNCFNPRYPFDADPRWILPLIDVKIYYALYPATLRLLIIVLFSWTWLPAVRCLEYVFMKLMGMEFKLQPSSPAGEKAVDIRSNSLKSQSRLRSKLIWLTPKLLLPASMACGAFVAYYPYFYLPPFEFVGVDTHWYYETLVQVRDFASVEKIVLSEPRAPYILLLYALNLIFQEPATAVKLGPAISAAFLSIAFYTLVKVGTENEYLAALSSLLGVFSIYTTGGMFAGIYTNWLAMAEVAFFLALFLKALRENSKKYLLSAILTSFLVLFTHAWTWGVLIGVMLSYMAMTLIRLNKRIFKSVESKREFAFILTVLLINLTPALAILLNLGLPFIPTPSPGSTYYDLLKAMNTANLKRLEPILLFTLTYYIGGFFATPHVYLLTALGAISIRDFKSSFNRLLASWLFVPSIIAVLMDSWFQWRLLYVLPCPILTALGLSCIIEKLEKSSLFMDYTKADEKLLTLLKFLLTSLTVLLLFNYTLRSMSYLQP